MNTKTPRRMLEMAQLINTTLPCDGHGSVEEWRKRFGERLKDGGYTPEEIEARAAETMRKAGVREAARANLKTAVCARLGEADDTDGYELLLKIMREAELFTSLRPGRKLGRLTKHVAYFARRSPRISHAYKAFFTLLREHAQLPAVQAWLRADLTGAELFARTYGQRPWASAAGEPLMFYHRDAFISCPRTKQSMPSSASLAVITNEAGAITRMHPSLADDPDIVRDPVCGLLILREAVAWITLDTGEVCWKRHNEANGAIAYDEDQEAWVRMGRGAVGGYHGARREWRGNEGTSRYRGCIGVELEVGFKSQGQLTKFLNRFVDDRGRFTGNRPFLVENDSSLSGITGGVEIISEPLPLYEGYQAPDAHWRWLLDKLVQGGAEGWKHRARAGIHVNLDVSDKKPNQVVRFIAFINNASSLSRFISGRKGIYGRTSSDNNTPLADAELSDLKAFQAKDKNSASGGYDKLTAAKLREIGSGAMDGHALNHLRGQGKYQPVNVRNNNVIEVRIFGSNIRYEGFMACVEYCVAGMAFVGQLENDAAALDADIGTQFRTWLSHNVAAYPNLAARIGVEESSETVLARPLAELVA